MESPGPRHVFVTGGARSGKSAFAEALLADREVDYVATSGTREGDAEWALRVAAHRASRPGHWRTLETCDLVPLLMADGPALLVEDATLWLTDVLDRLGWGSADPSAACSAFAAALAGSQRDVVVVSSEVGSGVVPEHASGRRFRDDLGRLNQQLAAACEEAYLVVAGRSLRLT